ncbi:hypothetical protein JW824_04205 [bacterium]|nr:hypothetical protein [bacterium]
MNRFRTCISILAIVLLSTLHVYGQASFQAGGNFTLGFPQNEFKNNIDNIGYGGTGFFAYRFPQSPLLVGASACFLVYGRETREEPFSLTIPDVFVDVTTTNSIIMGHLFLRLQPPRGSILPYLDGLFGFNYLSTRTTIENQANNEEVASSTNFDDITFSYGVGGGLMIRVFQPTQDDLKKNELQAVYVDLGIRYIKSGEAEYLKKGSILIENGKVTYDISKSATDLVTGHIGVVFTF